MDIILVEDKERKLEVQIKNSAHSPMFEEPKKVIQIMQENMEKGKNDLVDTH